MATHAPGASRRQRPGEGHRFELASRLPLDVAHDALVESDFEHVPEGDAAHREVLEIQGWIGNVVAYLPLGSRWAYLTAEDGLRLYSFDDARDPSRPARLVNATPPDVR